MIRRFSAFVGVLLLVMACGEANPSSNQVSNIQQPFIEPAVGVEATDGENLYATNCAACHGANGEGLGAFPALTSEGHAWHHADAFLISTIKYGRSPMPAFRSVLSDEDITDLIAYIKTWWEPNDLEQQRLVDSGTR